MAGDIDWDEKDFEVLPGARTFLNILESIHSSADAKNRILDAMKTTVAVDGIEVTPDLESLEHALHHVVLRRISELLVPDMESTSELQSVVDVLDVAADLVLELFNVSIAGASEAERKSEVEKLKSWWDMFFLLAEDVARLVPGPCMAALVANWEEKLVALKEAYVKMAKTKLEDLDQRQSEISKEKKGDAKEQVQRVEERKKFIGTLGISPNGKIHLTMTSLLKTLSSRLSAAPYWALRGRVTLLLERLLPIDHKAIANNQRNRCSDFLKSDEVDETAELLEDGIRTPDPTDEKSLWTDLFEKKKEDTKKDEKKKEEEEKAEGDGEDQKKNDSENSAEAKVAESNPHFDLYKSFWSIQESLQNPEKMVFGDSAGSKKQGDNWTKFKTGLQAVLKCFASYPAGPRAGPSALLPLRHAPKSKVFRIQIDDPGFRLQFLVQVLVVFQGLEEKNEKKGESVTGKQSQSVKREYRDLKAECEQAVKHINPRLLRLAKHVLGKEQLWASWKNQGCKEFEHESLQMMTGKAESVDLLMKDPPAPKQKRPTVEPYMGQMLKTLANPSFSTAPISEGVSEEALKPYQIKKMCDQYLNRLMEDEDPVNGIEEDYKMKNDKVFMWQCRRLFAQQYLREYRNVSGGTLSQMDFMDFVYQVTGVENPKNKVPPPEPETPAAEEPAKTEEMKEEVKEEAKEEVIEEVKEEADEKKVEEPPEKKQKIA